MSAFVLLTVTCFVMFGCYLLGACFFLKGSRGGVDLEGAGKGGGGG